MNKRNHPRPISEIEKELAEARKFELQKFDDYEKLKEETLQELSQKALKVSEIIKDFKKHAFAEMGALHDSLKELSQRHRDGKGNFRPIHGDVRISYRKQGKVTFDEKAVEAESYIKEFVSQKFHDDLDTMELIVSLLERKNGEFDIKLIQKLYKMEDRFDDENWRKGIRLLRQSYAYEHSKDYIAFEIKSKEGQWIQIPLNFSNI